MKRENDYKSQVVAKGEQLRGVPRCDCKAKPAKVKDLAIFDPDKYRGDASLMLPALEIVSKKHFGKVAILLLCLFAFTTVSAQNAVTLLNVSTKYVEFTWNGDTLNNVEFAPFFIALDYAEATAGRMANELTNSLMMRPTAVDEISGDMARTLFGVSFVEYACFFHLREYRARVVKR